MEAAVQGPLWSHPEGRAPFAEVDIGPNRVALLKDGYQAFPAMLDAIGRARSTIVLETYILTDDSMGRRFIDALCERARAGVEAMLMYDAWGSDVSEEALNELRSSGVKVLSFRPLTWLGTLGKAFAHLSRRNHRKSLVVDGLVAFTGGLNLSRDYAAEVDGGRGWRDTHVRMVGPAAVEVERFFISTWRMNRGPAYDAARFVRVGAGLGRRVKIIGNGFSMERKAIRKAYLGAIDRAERSIHLTHAYFLPPAKVMRSLVRAAQRGVAVSVILAASTDVKAVLYAARGLYPRLLRAGVAVYEWSGRILHAKTAVVDGNWCTVGSSNLDPMSLRHNLELNAVFEDLDLAAAVERMFEQDLTHCQRITTDTVRSYGPWQRLASWIFLKLRHWL
jgi:cardiolipin synthase